MDLWRVPDEIDFEADTLHKANSVRDSFEAQELERMQNEADQIDGAEKFTAPGGADSV